MTYSMQAPIADICDGTMVIAEQQGTQVYIVNRDGLLGNFETQIPILKARVSRQGVVALVLQDDTVTWVNLYQADGTLWRRTRRQSVRVAIRSMSRFLQTGKRWQCPI